MKYAPFSVTEVYMKAKLLFYQELHVLNIPFSLLLGFLGLSISGDFLVSFGLSLLTGGFLLSLYFYEKRYKANYYFYFNKGLSRLNLVLSAYSLNVLLLLILLLLKNLLL